MSIWVLSVHTTVTRGEHLVRVSESPDFPVELLGGWTTEIGSVCNEASKCKQAMYSGIYRLSSEHPV